MLKAIIIIVILFARNPSFGQGDIRQDSICIDQIQTAKNNCRNGVYEFCINPTWDLPFSRMYDVLDSLCKRYKLTLKPNPGIEHSETFYSFLCYSGFMDSILSQKYGKDFKDNLIKTADSIFIFRHSNDTIPYYYCDAEPEYIEGSEAFDSAFFSLFHIPKFCSDKLNSTNCNYNLSFIVDSKGNSSDYQSYSYSEAFDTCRKEIQRRLLACAEHFKYWKPAILGGTTVACKGNLFIDILRHHVVVE